MKTFNPVLIMIALQAANRTPKSLSKRGYLLQISPDSFFTKTEIIVLRAIFIFHKTFTEIIVL